MVVVVVVDGSGGREFAFERAQRSTRSDQIQSLVRFKQTALGRQLRRNTEQQAGNIFARDLSAAAIDGPNTRPCCIRLTEIAVKVATTTVIIFDIVVVVVVAIAVVSAALSNVFILLIHPSILAPARVVHICRPTRRRFLLARTDANAAILWATLMRHCVCVCVCVWMCDMSGRA